MWNAFPGSLLFVACRAGMKRSRKAGMVFVVSREKPASEPSARDVFRKRCPIRGSARVVFKIRRPIRGSARDVLEKNILPTSFLGRFFFKLPLRALFFGGFFPNHPFARCFSEVFLQITLSRVVFGRLFFKPPLRALFLGGFSSKTAFPCAWKCCFRWAVARLDVKNGKAHRGLFFLCGLFQSFASQLFSHVACFHIHVIDVFFAIVAA